MVREKVNTQMRKVKIRNGGEETTERSFKQKTRRSAEVGGQTAQKEENASETFWFLLKPF